MRQGAVIAIGLLVALTGNAYGRQECYWIAAETTTAVEAEPAEVCFEKIQDPGYSEVYDIKMKTAGKILVHFKRMKRILRCNSSPCPIPNGTFYPTSKESNWLEHFSLNFREHPKSPNGGRMTIGEGGLSPSFARWWYVKKPARPGKCLKAGCFSENCGKEIVSRLCDWKPQYACYQTAECKEQADGRCGFTETTSLRQCLLNPAR
ncbi:MAG: hypothetical protein HYY84_18905 [Deltaproteobacteria bacterium]|nr:hypothetical protein [Deltaproteobacteria bacterium]